ncbi:hypothetical protein DMUE_3741 [Dictyocoela muelleri]|nr:hypothetical protein DMUE_3741 [Dictyocoela muelleri]
MQKNLRQVQSEDLKISKNNNDNKNNNKNNKNNTTDDTIYNNIKTFYNNFSLADKISIIDSNGCGVSNHLEIEHNTKNPFNNSSDAVHNSMLSDNTDSIKNFLYPDFLISGSFSAKEALYFKKLIELVGLRFTYIAAKMHRHIDDIISFLFHTKDEINYIVGDLDVDSINFDLLTDIIEIEWSHQDQLIFIESFDNYGKFWEFYRLAGLSHKSVHDIKLYNKYYNINNKIQREDKNGLNFLLIHEHEHNNNYNNFNNIVDETKPLKRKRGRPRKDDNKRQKQEKNNKNKKEPEFKMNKININNDLNNDIYKIFKINKDVNKKVNINKKVKTNVNVEINKSVKKNSSKKRQKYFSKDLLENQQFMINWNSDERVNFAKYKVIQHLRLKKISDKINSKSHEEVVEYNNKFFKLLTKVEKLNEMGGFKSNK